MAMRSEGIYARYIKRILDIVCAVLGLTLFCWLYAIIAVAVRVKLGSPVVFRQRRPGKDEKIFELCKFRSMTDAVDENGAPLPDEQRLTKFGKLLRSTSLDELPELWCILKGDMSFIGPRPLLPSYLPYYTEREHLRHSVRPGLSGLSQVSGRNSLAWDKRLETDVEYVENISFLLDLKIVLLTVKKVLVRSDISVGEEGNLAELRSAKESVCNDGQ